MKTAVKDIEFKHENLPDLFQNVKAFGDIHNHPTLKTNKYTFSNAKGDYLEIYILGRVEWRFIDDNFPGQRRIFNTNIPYRNIEEFESDLDRMGIEKPLRKHE